MTAAAPALTTPPKQWPLFRGLVTGSFSTRELRLPPSIHTKRTTIVLNAADYCSLSSSARGELLASQPSPTPYASTTPIYVFFARVGRAVLLAEELQHIVVSECAGETEKVVLFILSCCCCHCSSCLQLLFILSRSFRPRRRMECCRNDNRQRGKVHRGRWMLVIHHHQLARSPPRRLWDRLTGTHSLRGGGVRGEGCVYAKRSRQKDT